MKKTEDNQQQATKQLPALYQRRRIYARELTIDEHQRDQHRRRRPETNPWADTQQSDRTARTIFDNASRKPFRHPAKRPNSTEDPRRRWSGRQTASQQSSNTQAVPRTTSGSQIPTPADDRGLNPYRRSFQDSPGGLPQHAYIAITPGDLHYGYATESSGQS